MTHAPVATVDAPPVSPVAIVTNLALGYLVSRSLHVATELSLADLLAGGPLSADDLAARTGAHKESLSRILRTLAAHGVFAETGDGRFANTPPSELLRQGVMRDGVLLCGEVAGDGSWWNAVGALRHSVMTGEPSFNRQHGMGFFDYIGQRPECARYFDRGMANFAAAEDAAIAATYDFSTADRIIDIGGGQGGLLAAILARHARPNGTLVDLPHVVHEPARLAGTLAGRWTTVGCDFFEDVPGGGDLYVLKRILHDWSDERSVRILRQCRAAMHDRARLLVVDAVVPGGNVPHPSKVMDILMMVFADGRERTEREFRHLFDQAGLALTSVTPTPSTLSIIEARPV